MDFQHACGMWLLVLVVADVMGCLLRQAAESEADIYFFIGWVVSGLSWLGMVIVVLCLTLSR